MIRSPFRLTFETNPDDCNLDCIMCERHSPFAQKRSMPERMAVELVQRVFSDLRNTAFREACMTSMGEPLLYKDFISIVDLCALGSIKMHITTNGTFPGGVRFWAEPLLRIGADIKISIHGAAEATQKSIAPHSSLDQVADNIRILISERKRLGTGKLGRSRITLKVTFMRANVLELPALVRLGFELGVDRIRGSHLASLFPETDDQRLDTDAETVLLFNRMIVEARQTAAQLSARFGRPIELSNFVPSEMNPVYGPCPFLGVEGWVTPDGRLVTCCVPEKIRPAHPPFGTLHEKGILEIWNGPEYRQFCKTYLDFPECRACIKRIAPSLREPQQLTPATSDRPQ